MIRFILVLGIAALPVGPTANADPAPILPPDIRIDIAAAINAVTPGEGVGYAAVGFDGTNFWVAQWQSARLTRISTAGVFVDSFTVAGLSGTRSMTWDGTHFWMANNTTTLTRVDPVTRTAVGTITLPIQARYAT